MEILIIALLILLNGALSMSEIALVSARKSKLETETKKGSKTAQTALQLSTQPDRFLSTIQIGITLIGILTGLYSGEAFAHDFAVVGAHIPALAPYSLPIAKTIIVVIVTYFTLVLGELVPKRLGMSKPERIAKIVAAPLNILSYIASPLVWFLSKSTSFTVKLLGIKNDDSNKITEEEIKAIVKEGLEVGEVEEVEHDIVERVFSLGDRSVDSIMTHRSDLVFLDINSSKEEIRKKVMKNMHNVYPVVSRSLDHMDGVVYLKDLFAHIDSPDFLLKNLISPAQYFHENQNTYSVLEQFKKANVKYGFITDEFGHIQGIVTLKDIMEALVGQVNQENPEQEIVAREDGSLLVDGQCSFYNFLEYFDMECLYNEHHYNTLSGLVLEELEHIPFVGEKLSWQNFEFEILDMDGVRIDKILVTLKKKKE